MMWMTSAIKFLIARQHVACHGVAQHCLKQWRSYCFVWRIEHIISYEYSKYLVSAIKVKLCFITNGLFLAPKYCSHKVIWNIEGDMNEIFGTYHAFKELPGQSVCQMHLNFLSQAYCQSVFLKQLFRVVCITDYVKR